MVMRPVLIWFTSFSSTRSRIKDPCFSLKTYETGKAGVWFLVFVTTVFIMGLVHVDCMHELHSNP